MAIDASQVIWITTANDSRGIPDPILNRMNVFEVQAPTVDQARSIARMLYTGIRTTHDWGRLIDPEPQGDVLTACPTCLREMRRALMVAFGKCAAGPPRHRRSGDLPRGASSRSRIGFLQ